MESLDHMRNRLEKRYELTYDQLQWPGRTVEVCAVRNFDDLFQELLSKDPDHPDIQDERIPYWADLWPSSIALGQYLLEQPPLAPGTTVLEVGAGLGLAGLAAHWQGGQVMLTDYLPEALEVARYLWALNGAEPYETAAMDWRAPDERFKADLIIAADVAYESRFFEPLIKTFRALLNPGGRILIAEPNRRVGQGWLHQMVDEGEADRVAQLPVQFQKGHNTVDIYALRV